MVLMLLMVGHLLGDFYFQTNAMARKKQTSFRVLLLHCFIYTSILYLFVYMITGRIAENFRLMLIIGLIHIFIDYIKIEVQKKWTDHKLFFFIGDQLLHIGSLYVLCRKMLFYINMEGRIFPYLEMYGDHILPIVLSMLICGKPAAIIISFVIQILNNPLQQNQIVAGQNQSQATVGQNQNTLRAGAWIGILEREIILILGILRQYEAIGFVLAAKSLARHRQLDDPDFAEKYLVGTLLSSLIALSCAIICVILINPLYLFKLFHVPS